MQSLDDIFKAEQAKGLEKFRAELAAEQAAWAALTPEQQAEIIAAREAKYAADFPDRAEEPDDDEDDEDDDEEEDE